MPPNMGSMQDKDNWCLEFRSQRCAEVFRKVAFPVFVKDDPALVISIAGYVGVSAAYKSCAFNGLQVVSCLQLAERNAHVFSLAYDIDQVLFVIDFHGFAPS